MLKFEKHKDKMLKLVDRDNGFAVKNNEPASCNDVKCEECEIRPSKTGFLCSSGIIRWLYEEYTPPLPKLTKRERAFCEAVGRGWLTRDDNGYLVLFDRKPEKGSHMWMNEGANTLYFYMPFFPKFEFITWEDEEPHSIEEMLKWEVEDETE